MKKLVIVTDAWYPQVNGVVTTLSRIGEQLKRQRIETEYLHPGLFRTLPTPGYAEIRFAWNLWAFDRLIKEMAPDYVHVATEGPLGWVARRWLKRHDKAYTTSLHTKFPEYINSRMSFVPVSLGYRYLRWFHRRANHTLVTTPSLAKELSDKGFERLVVWGRGVDVDTFKPAESREPDDTQPLMLYVGRVSVEKNLPAFLDLQMFGKKMVVGDGPALAQLRKDYPYVVFTGYQHGSELAESYSKADVFVFPSLTDTFGLVVLEALACATPVAAYPVSGPIDIVQEGITGALDWDLEQAVKRALQVPRENCRAYALEQSWDACAAIFADSLVSLNSDESGSTAALIS